MQHLDCTDSSTDLVQTPPAPKPPQPTDTVAEVGGLTGLEPTRYGDWEKNGRCVDF
jgi:hypothetical protein